LCRVAGCVLRGHDSRESVPLLKARKPREVEQVPQTIVVDAGVRVVDPTEVLRALRDVLVRQRTLLLEGAVLDLVGVPTCSELLVLTPQVVLRGVTSAVEELVDLPLSNTCRRIALVIAVQGEQYLQPGAEVRLRGHVAHRAEGGYAEPDVKGRANK